MRVATDPKLAELVDHENIFIIKGDTKNLNIQIIRGEKVIPEDMQVLLDGTMQEYIRNG